MPGLFSRGSSYRSTDGKIGGTVRPGSSKIREKSRAGVEIVRERRMGKHTRKVKKGDSRGEAKKIYSTRDRRQTPIGKMLSHERDEQEGRRRDKNKDGKRSTK